MSIIINISQQKLYLHNTHNQLIAEYSISTGKNGVGEKKGSEQTPRGEHSISEKIGDKMPIFTVFRARKPTGEIWNHSLSQHYPDRDWILTRILWLSGSEVGFNSGGEVDTRARHIYIHGTSEEDKLGAPHSHGCIRMRNQDVIDLFERVDVGERVLIKEVL